MVGLKEVQGRGATRAGRLGSSSSSGWAQAGGQLGQLQVYWASGVMEVGGSAGRGGWCPHPRGGDPPWPGRAPCTGVSPCAKPNPHRDVGLHTAPDGGLERLPCRPQCRSLLPW